MGSRYGPLWEVYWKDLPQRDSEAFWDCPPDLGAATHIRLFGPYADPTLPLIDVGCGNGTQTAYLAGHYERVLGVDIAEAALAKARQVNGGPRVEYRRLDILDEAAVREFRDELGEVNVYLSGVIHQLTPADRDTCIRSLALLTGGRGTVFAQELTPDSYHYMAHLITTGRHDLPKLDRVSAYFGIGLQTAAGEAELEAVFTAARFELLAAGSLSMHTTEKLTDGTPLTLPAHYVVARPQRP
ncbi:MULTISPECIES: class I SAM-dependent methyltransferase [unclassified Streptomyces]|uniref:class I SAM-dependent methyltransferase n=1 Tax=unclassified Streptomyces TaxID=2593676 RepID=UPI00381A71D0